MQPNPKITTVFLGFILLCIISCTGPIRTNQPSPISSKEPIVYPHGKPKYRLWQYPTSYTNMYSENDDIQLGTKVMDKQIKVFKKKKVGVDLAKHKSLQRRLQNIANRIARVSDKPNYPYEVHVFDKPKVVNAFCMPGGKIGFYTGIFDNQKGLIDKNNNHQIAAVMGHEIAHATLRHVTRRMTSLQSASFLGSIASVFIGHNLGTNASRLFNDVFYLGANLYLPSYSRKFEKEADQVGFYYMAKAGFNPKAAIDVWQGAAKRKGASGDKTHFLASHPASGQRAKALKKWLPEAQLIYRQSKK